MTISALVTTSDDPDDDIQLQAPGAYRLVVPVGPGEVDWNFEEADSPYLHGSIVVNATRTNPVMPLTVLVEGSSKSELASNISDLVDAFTQFRYHFKLTIDTIAWEWKCYPARITTESEGAFARELWRINKQVFNLRVPRNPTPVTGIY